MNNINKSPAELKEQQRETKSLVVNIFLATLIIGFALITTFFDFKSLASKTVISAAIIAASLLCLFLLVRWLRSLDEFEKSINAQASTSALYSSLLYLPLQYLSEIGVIPEFHIAFLFMFIWLVYLGNVFYMAYKR